MQNLKRSIIIIVDNRARSIKRDNNIVAIERNELDRLENIINSEFETNIILNQKGIDLWKKQFTSMEENI